MCQVYFDDDDDDDDDEYVCRWMACFPSVLQKVCSVMIYRIAASGAYHEFYETFHSVIFYFMKKDSKRCCNTTTPESIHTKDESKRSSAFAFIFGVN